MDLQSAALDLFKLTKDPLALDAVRVLADPTDPSYDQAKDMVERMLAARDLLFCFSPDKF